MYNMKPMTQEEVKNNVKSFDYVWIYLTGEHYECKFDDLFCLQVREIYGECIDFFTLWDEMVVYFCEYGNTWRIYAENPEPYGWTDDEESEE